MLKLSLSERSLLSPTRWPPQAFAWWRSLLFLGTLLLAGPVGILIGVLLAHGLGPAADDVPNKLTWTITMGQLFGYVLILVVVVRLLPRLSARSFTEIGWRRLNARALVAALVGAVAMYAVTFIVTGIQFLFTHSRPHESIVALFYSTQDPALIAALAVIATIVAPVVEEFVFRGFLFNAVLRYAPVWAAAAISGLLFGLAHFSPSALAPLACSGIVLAYVYYVSGSLTASMITHAVFNALGFAALATGHR